MENLEFWLDNGTLVERPVDGAGLPLTERAIWQSRDIVKVETSATGTKMSWMMFAANWASLFYAREWLSTLTAPYTLEYFNVGWYSETHDTFAKAASRLDVILAKSDIRFSSRAFTQEHPLNPTAALPDIRSAIEAGAVPDEKAVICTVDFEQERTPVESIGKASALANVWGMSPVAYPRLNGHSYDKVVSRPYYEVARSGRPYHDHVLAAMTKPDGEVRWFGYQRLIVPGKGNINGLPTVNILCQFGPVDISLL